MSGYEADDIGNITVIKHKTDSETIDRLVYDISYHFIKVLKGICELFEIDKNTGKIKYTAKEGDVGEHIVSIYVNDSIDSAKMSFKIEVIQETNFWDIYWFPISVIIITILLIIIIKIYAATQSEKEKEKEKKKKDVNIRKEKTKKK